MAKFSIFGMLAAMALAAGCGGDFSNNSYDALGAPYEIIVVADHQVWDGPAGDTLRSMFHKAYPMINREETMFDVLRVLPSGFKKLNTRHRNVLITAVDPSATQAGLSMSSDVYARPQTVLRAVAPDLASLSQLLGERRDDIMLLLENAEKDRDVAAATTHTPTQIAALIKEKFGFEMSTGPGYVVQKMENESDDFLWLRYEMPTADQGIVIYTYPFSGVKDFDRENLLKRRDEFAARIPGENPGSHMATNPDFTSLVYKKIDGRRWSEMHGFWDVTGDFMGGPYTNYSTLDAANQRVIAVDFYVYSPDPRLSQRNYIKQLEHLLYTVGISGEAPVWE
jgi:hypothetical protein